MSCLHIRIFKNESYNIPNPFCNVTNIFFLGCILKNKCYPPGWQHQESSCISFKCQSYNKMYYWENIIRTAKFLFPSNVIKKRNIFK